MTENKPNPVMDALGFRPQTWDEQGWVEFIKQQYALAVSMAEMHVTAKNPAARLLFAQASAYAGLLQDYYVAQNSASNQEEADRWGTRTQRYYRRAQIKTNRIAQNIEAVMP